ncbi:HalOD1 output domain-containing protein [Halomarina litorea]|uniref:HalOD1 output domain-containing protein n=1 Tax=Halomarina litorea TaxID=2961595 RepID=UPI0020C415FD|nr:HalOD1 output domain-containing protein [Halomarina sp. BCD28]
MSTDDAGTRRHDTHQRSLTIEIVRALAAEHGCRPEALRPRLYEAIDPDALEALFAPCGDGTPRAPGCVVFEIGSFEVTVEGDRNVSVASAE